jgi:hypothetical protein
MNAGDHDMADVVSESDASVDVSVDADAAPVEEMTPDVIEEPDGPVVSACNEQNCGGACCGDECVRDCSSCDAGKTFCPNLEAIGGSNGTCVPSCAGCAIDGVPAATTCAACQFGFTTISCATTLALCPAAIDAGACGCTPDAGTGASTGCPGPTQVCVQDTASPTGGTCLTCGEPGTNLGACVAGNSCHQDAGTCAP